MNEELLGLKIKSVLDDGLALRPEVVARLRVARERALDGCYAYAGELSVAGARRASGVRVGAPSDSWVPSWVPVLVLIAALLGIYQWQEARQAAMQAAERTAEIVEVDTGVLIGDLPINAYLDEDFDAWLKQSSE